MPEQTGEVDWVLAETQASGGHGRASAGTATPARPSEDDPDSLRLKATVKGKLFGTEKAEKVRIGRFVVLKRLGEGGMGVVYAAYDSELDRKIAIKLLHPEASIDGSTDQATARLMREAQALARVSHPNVVQIYEVGAHGSEVYVAMEFVDGVTLSEWLSSTKDPPWREVLDVFIPAGRGLAAAHAKKLVHRDFKPANVLVAEDGQVRVLDFGLARRVRSPRAASDLTKTNTQSGASNLNLTITNAGVRLGTPAYMAPEQHLGDDVDARTDQFCFCIALYEALYGQRPFPGNNMTALAMNVTQGKMHRAPKGSKVPDWLRRIVVRGLEVDPENRWPSMEALLEQLGRDPGAKRRRMWLILGGGRGDQRRGVGRLRITVAGHRSVCGCIRQARRHLGRAPQVRGTRRPARDGGPHRRRNLAPRREHARRLHRQLGHAAHRGVHGPTRPGSSPARCSTCAWPAWTSGSRRYAPRSTSSPPRTRPSSNGPSPPPPSFLR